VDAYFSRICARGKLIRRSLKTNKLTVARLRLILRLRRFAPWLTFWS